MPVTPKYRGSTKYMLVYAALINAAHTRTTVSYKEVATLLGIHQAGHHMAREVGIVLGEISDEEHQQGRPMLSAIAISTEGRPSDGFFGLAADLGRLENESPEGKRQFWAAEKQAVYTTWQ
jgi:hypothetical protein